MRFSLMILVAISVLGCRDPKEVDNDGDGLLASEDCDDFDAEVGPPSTWFLDADSDGWGDSASTMDACEQPDDHTDLEGDCNDGDPTIHPESTELCNDIDEDCDGEIDEGTALGLWYEDNDGDGYGDPELAHESCTGTGYVADDSDCDDGDANVHPDADELCNDVDDDCDGEVDEDPIDAGTVYADEDGDGYGNPSSPYTDCDVPTGYVDNDDDCDDYDSSVHPGADELCDGDDTDCDGTVDEDDAVDAPTWYEDGDNDGYGTADNSAVACDAPSGFVDNADDCDDSDRTLSPDTTWYADADGDGYGDSSSTLDQCEQPSGYTDDRSDCDDSDDSVNPDATEVCDGIDNDCDGTSDGSDAADVVDIYRDSDGDGYGDASVSYSGCTIPSGWDRQR